MKTPHGGSGECSNYPIMLDLSSILGVQPDPSAEPPQHCIHCGEALPPVEDPADFIPCCIHSEADCYFFCDPEMFLVGGELWEGYPLLTEIQ